MLVLEESYIIAISVGWDTFILMAQPLEHDNVIHISVTIINKYCCLQMVSTLKNYHCIICFQ